MIVVRDAAGAAVDRTVTDAAGTYFSAVGAGTYTVEPQPVDGIMGTPPPQHVVVVAGQRATADFAYDTRDPLTAQRWPYHGRMHLSVALVQLDATDDVATNIATAVGLADEAAAGGARLVALPEYLQFRGPDGGFRASARPIPGPHTDPFAEVATSA